MCNDRSLKQEPKDLGLEAIECSIFDYQIEAVKRINSVYLQGPSKEVVMYLKRRYEECNFLEDMK